MSAMFAEATNDLTPRYGASGTAMVAWGETSVGALLTNIVAGKNLRCEERPPHAHERGVVKISAVTWGVFDPLASKTLPNDFEPPANTRIEVGDFLISRANTLDLVGSVVVVDQTPTNLFLSDKVLRLEMADQDKRWLLWFLRSPTGRQAIEGAATGNQLSMRNLSQSQLKSIRLPWPSAAERRRIVAKIDSLSGKSRRAREHLDHIPRLVEKYKQAVLAAAFRGELIGLSPQATSLPDEKCWELPMGWRWVSFSEAAVIASNLVKPNDIPDLPHIAPDNIEARTGRLLPFKTIKEDEVISPKHRFKPGQLLYSKIRPYLRKAVLIDFEGACSADMYPLSPREDVASYYLLYWLISEQFAAFTIEHEGRTVLPKINQHGLNCTWFPLAPLAAQIQIALRIRESFQWIDRLAAEATSARKLINQLDQAVLAKAFRGELVPQDPSDEPASVLLERIRADRATDSDAKAKRKKRG